MLNWRLISSTGAGILTALCAAAAALVAVFTTALLVDNFHPRGAETRTALAVLMLVLPLVAGLVALVLALAFVDARWRVHQFGTAAVAMLICGVALIGLFQIVTAFNSCVLDVSFPYPGQNVCR